MKSSSTEQPGSRLSWRATKTVYRCADGLLQGTDHALAVSQMLPVDLR
jgi:hypothetical protein